MKVGFNARLLADSNLRGWNRYTVNLLAELPALGVTPVLYGDKPFHPSHLARLPEGSYESRVEAVRPYVLWEQFWLPRQCARDGVALLHAPANFGLPWFSHCPRVLTLHDAIDSGGLWRSDKPEITFRFASPSAFRVPRVVLAPCLRMDDRGNHGASTTRGTRAGGSWRSAFFHAAARKRAHRVITVSVHARDEIIALLNVSAKKMRVIPEAADPIFLRPISDEDRQRVRLRYAIHAPYLFYVGGWEERKNLPFLIQAFAAADLPGVKLVLAGGRDLEREAMRNAYPLGDRLHLLGRVDENDLPALYAEALAFVYPSKHEGFGLQLCEAMAVGCPVFAARATSLPEVLGSGGLTFGLDAIAELVELLRRVITDRAFRDDLVSRGRLRSRDFSWSRTAAATVEVYRELMETKRSGR